MSDTHEQLHDAEDRAGLAALPFPVHGTAAGGLAEVLVATNCPSASWWAMTTRSACQRSSSSVEMPA